MDYEMNATEHSQFQHELLQFRPKTLVFPIDENGFVLWTSERYRLEREGYQPAADEIITPIPRDTVWYQPRWDGAQLVEGKGHPGFPVLKPETQLPSDGVFWMTSQERPKTIKQMVSYMLESDLTAKDVTENLTHFADVRVIPVLIKEVQALHARVNELENLNK